jgi:hypothetical protein
VEWGLLGHGTVMGIVCAGCLGHLLTYRIGINVRHCLSDLGLMVSEAVCGAVNWILCLWSGAVCGCASLFVTRITYVFCTHLLGYYTS